MSTDMVERLVNTSTVAAILEITVNKVRELARMGFLPYVRGSKGQFLFTEGDVLELWELMEVHGFKPTAR